MRFVKFGVKILKQIVMEAIPTKRNKVVYCVNELNIVIGQK